MHFIPTIPHTNPNAADEHNTKERQGLTCSWDQEALQECSWPHLLGAWWFDSFGFGAMELWRSRVFFCANVLCFLRLGVFGGVWISERVQNFMVLEV